MNLSTVKKLAKLFATTISDLAAVIPSASCCIFLITPNMIMNRQLLEHRLMMQKSVLEGKYIDAIGKLDVPMADPQFKKFKDANQPLRTIEFMTTPIYNTDGELCLNIQLLSRKKKNSKFLITVLNAIQI